MKNIENEKVKIILNLIRSLRPKLYRKMMLTGRLFESLMEGYEEDITIDKAHYIEAAYLCNIGFLAIEENIHTEKFYKPMEIDLIKKHVYQSMQYLELNGFTEAAKIVEQHHEYPNGMGYFRNQLTDRVIAYLNIADEFIDCTTEYYRNNPLMTHSHASEIVLGRYRNSTLLNKIEVDRIEARLKKYYTKYVLNV